MNRYFICCSIICIVEFENVLAAGILYHTNILTVHHRETKTLHSELATKTLEQSKYPHPYALVLAFRKSITLLSGFYYYA